MARPKLAVFKFASCDGCQLSLLDCEDELLAVVGEVEIANFLEASRAVEKGPYDLALVEGSITTSHDAERIRSVRKASRFLITIGACATAGGIQALRNFKDVREFTSAVYATPEYVVDARGLDPDRAARARGFRAARLPDQQGAARRGARRLPARPPAEHPDLLRLPRVQATGHGLRDGGARHALPRPGHAGRLRRHLPFLPARLLRLLRSRRRRPTPRRSAPGGRPTSVRAGPTWCGPSAPSTPTRPHSAPRATPMSTNVRSRVIKVDALARVEGEGGLTVQLRGGRVADVKLRIYEPPRFFEAFLRGRSFREVPDITARICGICPVAYQMSAVHAMEAACGVDDRRADPRSAAPALLRRVDREPRAARLHAARAGLPRLRERHPHGGRPCRTPSSRRSSSRRSATTW